MRILVIGSGGREHAIARALAESRSTDALYVAPGNPGTAQVATNVDIDSGAVEELAAFAAERSIDLTIVGPEAPLVDGIVDRFRDEGLAVVGPTKAAARLEGSKAFANRFMERHGIPTADFRVFAADERDAAADHIRTAGAPIVVKASGLAAGKGAFVCDTVEEAIEALDEIVTERSFGEAGDRVVIEECMEGEEASVLALADGTDYVLLTPSQDHKPIGEGDTGPNTGGMGAYAPAPVVDGGVLQRTCDEIIEPTLAGMDDEGTPYSGVLYCGLMVTDEGPKVVEYNCRLGDPEAQVVLPLISGDLAEVFAATAGGELRNVALDAASGAAACVVLASDGYPVDYETGFEITGVDAAEALDRVSVIHAGTERRDDGTLVTAGGRVLGVTATGETLQDALDRAYEGADRIEFEGKTFRRDIGQKGLDRIATSA